MEYFSHNGVIKPAAEAKVSLTSTEFTYGYGVYENIRISKGVAYFLDDHCQRLLDSAQTIALEHTFNEADIKRFVLELIDRIKSPAYNLKLLLIGGKTPAEANLYILGLNPFFPNRALYKAGVKLITYQYERLFPQAKTLNMLPSYLAYRQAKQQDAYDALLLDRDGHITEGTRTNFCGLQGRTIVSPPEIQILPGITRKKVFEVAHTAGFKVATRDIALSDLTTYEGLFITSTSSKILPVRQVDDTILPPAPEALRELMKLFDDYLASQHSTAGSAHAV